jgi:TonB-linked SusC/RagA family outer membrane protein
MNRDSSGKRWLGVGPWCPGLAVILALLVVVATPVAAQQGQVGGVVVSAENLRPLPDATVEVLGTGRGTFTNQNGRFLLLGLTGQEVTLRVSLIGYGTSTVTARVGDVSLSIQLGLSAIELDRIVVTGTPGEQAKRSLGNTVATVEAASVMEVAPINTLSELINGRAPGVTIIHTTGMVGGGNRVRIRGAGSFSLSNEPLIYVDGVRVNNEQATGPTNQAFGSASISRWNDLNPEDIESIEIIKGPAAATLYGTEASNGVVQIITKRGRAGAARFDLSVKQGASWFSNPEERLWVNYYDVGNNGSIESIDMVELEKSRGNDIWRTGQLQQYDLSVSGGMDLVRYYLSGNYENTEGVEPDNSVDKWGMRANVTVTPNDKWDIRGNLGYVSGRTNLSYEAGGGGFTWTTYFARPDRLDGPRRGFYSGTPESYTGAFDQWQDLDRTTAGVTINHRPFSRLSHRLTFGFDHTREQDNDIQYHDEQWLEFWTFSDRGYRWTQERNVDYTTVDYAATYQWPVTDKLESSTSVGGQFYRHFTELVSAYGEVWPTPGLTSIRATTQNRSADETSVENTTIGVYAQEQLAWQNRLFLTAALRGDDNSAFGVDYDFVTYPKVSTAWVVSEEPFWNFDFANTVKLRAAYGESGQQPDAFVAIRTFQPVAGPNNVGTVTPDNLGNPDLGPERGTEIELGFDAGLWDDKVGVEFTYYYQKTKDAILLREIAPSTGFSGSQWVNAGEIKNSGIELLVRGTPWETDRHSLELTFNLSTNDNEVLSLGDVTDEDFISAGTYLRHQIGYPVGSWFSPRVVSAEFDANGRAINLLCDDGHGGSTSCSGAPNVYMGRTVPSTEGGFASTLTLFNNIRLFAQLDFKAGFTKLDGNYRVRCYFFAECRENWYPTEFDPAKIAEIQAAGTYAGAILDDGDFLKLREVAVSYGVPSEWVSQIGARSGNITVAARNLYTWTKFMGLEPESTFNGGSRGGSFSLWEQNVLPQLAQLVVTFNVSF